MRASHASEAEGRCEKSAPLCPHLEAEKMKSSKAYGRPYVVNIENETNQRQVTVCACDNNNTAISKEMKQISNYYRYINPCIYN